MAHENNFEGDGGPLPVIVRDCDRCEAWAREYAKLEAELAKACEERDEQYRLCGEAKQDAARYREEARWARKELQEQGWKGACMIAQAYKKQSAYLKACKFIHSKWRWLAHADWGEMYGTAGLFENRHRMSAAHAQALARANKERDVLEHAASEAQNRVEEVAEQL